MEINRSYGRIGVLMGGPSSERAISLKSGHAVYEALRKAGLSVVAIDIATDSQTQASRVIRSHRIDCAFIALHGRFGEDGQIQEVLEGLGLPYTGSGALASRLAMDKIGSLRIFQMHGLFVPRFEVLAMASHNLNWMRHMRLGFPVVVKPAAGGSSIGLSIVEDSRGLDRAVDEAFRYDSRVILQEYISGREITVGILEERALSVIEIVPKNKFFDYEAKYQAGMTEYIVPARLPGAVARQAQKAALAAHKLLGCWACSRVDIILDGGNRPFLLEINTIPGMTATSLLPKAAAVTGMDFTALCLKLVELAYEKTKRKPGA